MLIDIPRERAEFIVGALLMFRLRENEEVLQKQLYNAACDICKQLITNEE